MHTYKGKARVERAITENTQRFAKSKDLKHFSRQAEVLHESGVCKAVIDVEGRKLCSLHPTRHDGADLRDKLCDKDFLCSAMKYYLYRWDDEMKQKFLDFIAEKSPDWF